MWLSLSQAYEEIITSGRILKSTVKGSVGGGGAGPVGPGGRESAGAGAVEVLSRIDAGEGFPLEIPGAGFINEAIVGVGGAAGVVELGDFEAGGGVVQGGVDFVAGGVLEGDDAGPGNTTEKGGLGLFGKEGEHEDRNTGRTNQFEEDTAISVDDAASFGGGGGGEVVLKLFSGDREGGGWSRGS